MSDSAIAAIGRRLAYALHAAAHNRDQESKRAVALLHTELCAAVFEEETNNEKETQSEAPAP